MWPHSYNATADDGAPPKRFVTICASLGIYGPSFFPKEIGANYISTPYLDLLKDHRKQMTIFSGLSHPEQSGLNGHSSEMTWLTSKQHPGLNGFCNTISIDQLAAEKFGMQTRYPTLVMGTNHVSQSYNRNGVMIPAETSPAQIFAKLFITGSPTEVKDQLRNLKVNRSILDTVSRDATRMNTRLGQADRSKLDEYFTSIREMEQKLVKSEEWVQKPKPIVTAKAPTDISAQADTIGRMQLLFDLVPLALQTDSTRLITILISGRSDVPPLPSVNIDHHNLSHHGKEPEKLRQLHLIETAELTACNSLLTALKQKKEGQHSLLDNTMVLIGSNLGNANSHDWKNLPILLAGGDFKHGQHIACDAANNLPLSNLFVQLLQHMNIEVNAFGSSTGNSVPGFT